MLQNFSALWLACDLVQAVFLYRCCFILHYLCWWFLKEQIKLDVTLLCQSSVFFFLFFLRERATRTWLNLLTLAFGALKNVGMYNEHTEVGWAIQANCFHSNAAHTANHIQAVPLYHRRCRGVGGGLCSTRGQQRPLKDLQRRVILSANDKWQFANSGVCHQVISKVIHLLVVVFIYYERKRCVLQIWHFPPPFHWFWWD